MIFLKKHISTEKDEEEIYQNITMFNCLRYESLVFFPIVFFCIFLISKNYERRAERCSAAAITHPKRHAWQVPGGTTLTAAWWLCLDWQVSMGRVPVQEGGVSQGSDRTLQGHLEATSPDTNLSSFSQWQNPGPSGFFLLLPPSPQADSPRVLKSQDRKSVV